MNHAQEPPSPSFFWQPKEMRLSSGDRILIVTDIYTYRESLYPCSARQAWFRVGAVNLKDNRVGYWRFSIDDARALLKSGLPLPSWDSPQSVGVEIKRLCHATGNKMGRFHVTASLVSVPAEVLAKTHALRNHFERKRGHVPNFVPGSWDGLAKVVAREIAIEAAALVMVGIFKAGAIQKLAGKAVKSDQITRVLRRLVEEGRLTPVSPKRYEVATPKIIPRLDWTG